MSNQWVWPSRIDMNDVTKRKVMGLAGKRQARLMSCSDLDVVSDIHKRRIDKH